MLSRKDALYIHLCVSFNSGKNKMLCGKNKCYVERDGPK